MYQHQHQRRQWVWLPLLKIYGAPLVFFCLLGGWLVVDLQQGHEKILTVAADRAVQRSQLIGQSFNAKIVAIDYVLRDVLGRIQQQDVVYPDVDRDHAQRMTMLLKEKADTVPDFFAMVIFNKDCVFTALSSGQHVGIRSEQGLCEERRRHFGSGPLVRFVPGARSVSGQPVMAFSRNLLSPTGEFQGGVLAVIELDKIQRWLDSPDIGVDDSVALLDDSQALLARYPRLAGVAKPEMQAAFAAMAAGAGRVARVDLDGRERLFGIAKIEGLPFTVAYGFDYAKMIGEWQRLAVELAAGLFMLLLLVLLAVWSQWKTHRQREELLSSEEHFRMLAENMADIVWRVNAQMRFTYVNAADQKVRGFAREEVIGTYVRDNLTRQGQDMLEEEYQKREALNNRHMALKYELPMRHKDGSEVWIEILSVPIYGSEGNINGYQGMGRDVSERRRHEAKLLRSQQQMQHRLQAITEEKSALQALSIRDPLTGLYNRRYLDEVLPRELARSKRAGNHLAVIMVDLDHFKKVNDQYGHAAGDEVLKAMAGLMIKDVRESDLVCRYGGEEFVAIMPNMSADQALDRIESWRQTAEGMSVVCGDRNVTVTLSAGIAAFPEHADSVDLLLACADEMLYQSKREGRNRISVYPNLSVET